MIIVSHRIFLRTSSGEAAIRIDIHEPGKQEKVWSCRYDIDWPEGKRTFQAVGFDALQSLVLALQMIGAEIYSSAYHLEGRLRAYDGEKGYGFPVSASLRDLLVGADKVAM